MLPTKLDSTHMDMVNNLQKMQGMKFDMQYINDQIAGHKAAIEETQHEADTGNDPAKNFAMQLMPTLKMHLQMAEDLQSKMNGMMNGNGSINNMNGSGNGM
jgi:predicted outer membrane protein